VLAWAKDAKETAKLLEPAALPPAAVDQTTALFAALHATAQICAGNAASRR
jgi:hypothetical protein